MSPEPAPPLDDDQLLQWIGKLLNGTATPQQHALLNQRLAEDADARAVYRRYVNLHVALHAYCGLPGAPDNGLSCLEQDGSQQRDELRNRYRGCILGSLATICRAGGRRVAGPGRW